MFPPFTLMALHAHHSLTCWYNCINDSCAWGTNFVKQYTPPKRPLKITARATVYRRYIFVFVLDYASSTCLHVCLQDRMDLHAIGRTTANFPKLVISNNNLKYNLNRAYTATGMIQKIAWLVSFDNRLSISEIEYNFDTANTAPKMIDTPPISTSSLSICQNFSDLPDQFRWHTSVAALCSSWMNTLVCWCLMPYSISWTELFGVSSGSNDKVECA